VRAFQVRVSVAGVNLAEEAQIIGDTSGIVTIAGSDQNDLTMLAVFLPQERYQVSLVRQLPIINTDAPRYFPLQEGPAAK
jgi:regulator of RNase E activity RraA